MKFNWKIDLISRVLNIFYLLHLIECMNIKVIILNKKHYDRSRKHSIFESCLR